jgi:hypothetical protein
VPSDLWSILIGKHRHGAMTVTDPEGSDLLSVAETAAA